MTESVSRLLINQELAGSNIRETWTDPNNGTLYSSWASARETTDQALQQIAKCNTKCDQKWCPGIRSGQRKNSMQHRLDRECPVAGCNTLMLPKRLPLAALALRYWLPALSQISHRSDGISAVVRPAICGIVIFGELTKRHFRGNPEG